MANGTVITFAAPKLESDDFFVLALLYDLGCDFATPVGDVVAVDVHQHLESRRFTRLNVEKIDIDSVAFGYSVLPTASFNNCVSHKRKGAFWGKSRANSHIRAALASE